MTAAAFISALQPSIYEYGASQHIPACPLIWFTVLIPQQSSPRTIFLSAGGGGAGVFNVTCHWCDHKQHFYLNQYHLDATADGGRAAVG